MNIKFIDFQVHKDNRGDLVSIEYSKDLPFLIQRVYYLCNTKENVRRGFHAHKKLKQLMVVAHGACKLLLDNGIEKVDILMNDSAKGVLIDSVIWREIYDFSNDCVLMVFANELYDESDYIREYSEFLKFIEK